MRKVLFVVLAVGLSLAWADSVRADEQADLKALLNKAIKAHGGEEILTKYVAGTSKFKGKLSVMGMDLETTGEFSMQLPDRLRVDLAFDIMGQKITVIQVFNGAKGWLSTNGTTMELDGDLLNEGKEGMHVFRVQQLVPLVKDKAFKLQSLGEVKVGTRDALGVQVTHKDFRDVNLYFDKEKNILLKVEHRTKDMNSNEVNQETFYDEYKEAFGVPYAVKMNVKQDGKPFMQLEIIDFKPAEKLDNSLFDKP